MKKTLLLVTLLVLVASISLAQMPSVKFGVQGDFGSINVPEPMKSVYGSGLGGGAHLDISFAILSLRVSGDYITFAPDNGKYQEALAKLTGSAASLFSIDGGRINIMSGNVNLKWAILPLPIVTPYMTGGIGLASVSVNDATIKMNGVPQGTIGGVKGETKTAFNVGAGVDLKIGITLFLEAKYTWIMTEGETSTYIPISLGVTF
jgi:opacity protein-like surface antigen